MEFKLISYHLLTGETTLLFERVHLYIGKHFQSIYTFIHLCFQSICTLGNTFRANYWDGLAGIAMISKGGFCVLENLLVENS